jgi:molybdopterin/thiamine biosynthesis adenylyltransferase/rhodanese-related sulfurtransferase
MLTHEENNRYQKQLAIPEWDSDKQLRLKNAHVLIVGAGGLGVTVIPYLAAVGVGKLTIIDHDEVELSNLGRQVIYRTDQVGQSKAILAKAFADSLNPHVAVEAIVAKFSLANHTLIKDVDLVIDCTDNFETRYLINDSCVKFGKAFVYAAIHTWEGQLAVCNAFGTGPTYRCLFPDEPRADEIPSCNEAGVLGFLPGMLGLMQAKEAIFYLTGIPSPAQNHLLRWDVRTMRMHTFRMDRSADAAERIFPHKPVEMIEISASEAATRLRSGEIQFVLDVREPFEWDLASLPGSIQMPMNSLQVGLIPKETKGVVLCHHGMRSMYVLKHLQAQGFSNLLNVVGGIDAWSREVDKSIPRY